jgi:maleate isomerase
MARALMGVLTPSSNTVLEPATSALVAEAGGVSAHFARITVTRIALSDTANDQFGLAPMLAACRMLAEARVGVIAWSGTSASWLGEAWEKALCAAIVDELGIPAFTAVGAINELIGLAGATRIGLVSPYTPDVQQKIVANYAEAGIAVVGEAHAGLSENFAFAELDDETVKAMCRKVAASRPQAIVIMCTNMTGWNFMAEMEAELGIPLIDSTAAVVWKGLSLLGVDAAPLGKRGWMFGQTA